MERSPWAFYRNHPSPPTALGGSFLLSLPLLLLFSVSLLLSFSVFFRVIPWLILLLFPKEVICG